MNIDEMAAALPAIDQGKAGQTDEVIPWGWRKATYTFTFKCFDDSFFGPKVRAAFVELDEARGKTYEDINDFTATNGVIIHVSYPDIDYTELDKIDAARPKGEPVVLDLHYSDGTVERREFPGN